MSYNSKYTGAQVDEAIGKVSGLVTGKLDASAKGAVNGVASLDENGKVPASQLPSFVDDVLEFYSVSGKTGFYKDSAGTTAYGNGTSGIIYVDVTTSKTYRWSGTGFIEIGSDSLVKQNKATTGSRPLLMANSSTAGTSEAHFAESVTANAADGSLKANKYNISTGATISFDSTNKCITFTVN